MLVLVRQSPKDGALSGDINAPPRRRPALAEKFDYSNKFVENRRRKFFLGGSGWHERSRDR
jgi:hypothetical protein